jgi:hypothetical protein
MEKEFIPYHIALAMKELGFDEPTICSYYRGGEGLYMGNIIHLDDVPAPLYQQAFRWFREKHGLFAEICLWGDGIVYTSVVKHNKNPDVFMASENSNHKIYEQAQLACLRKLIEIVKENL